MNYEKTKRGPFMKHCVIILQCFALCGPSCTVNFSAIILSIRLHFSVLIILQAGVKHIILAVSYRAEMLENELKVEEERVCF